MDNVPERNAWNSDTRCAGVFEDGAAAVSGIKAPMRTVEHDDYATRTKGAHCEQRPRTWVHLPAQDYKPAAAPGH